MRIVAIFVPRASKKEGLGARLCKKHAVYVDPFTSFVSTCSQLSLPITKH